MWLAISVALSLTIAFVLAIVVPFVVVLALRTSRNVIDLRQTTERWRSETSLRFAKIESEVATKSPAGLAARLADLEGVVDSNSQSVRKQFGRVWGTIGAAKTGASSDAHDMDDDLAALLRLQSAPAVQPGKTQ